MNDDALKKLWQEQRLVVPALPDEAQIAAMKMRMTCFDKTIQWRDYGEVAACIFIIVFFGWDLLFRNISALTQAGCLVLVGSAGFIAWKLMWSKCRLPKAEPSAPIFDAVRVELRKVENQIGLLESVAWWYLLPLFIGVILHNFGAGGGFLSKLIYFTFVLALYVFIYWLNQRAVKKNLLPLKRGLESLLHSAETGEPLDDTEVANLRRTLGLSIGAANRVKPVEFKVAFWQIAIFGVPGIVGIWFFLMLGLALDNKGWKTEERPRTAVVQSVPVEETNRYSIVARKVVDLFNAGDYAAVQKLYNSEMSKRFPSQKASEFFTNLAEGFGKIEKFDGQTTNGYQGWTAFRLHGQRGELTMSLALDANDKISGIYFKPAPRPSVTIKSLVRGVFGWRRLIWLPPFFLAGLLYSWLMQKVTKRAVGISALGIHLNKGLNLILWDEIKEVRPFRFLHVRNLWLITESGEKSIMHWTPLERHSDLKAAVESFAPANHPIRKYLALLQPE